MTFNAAHRMGAWMTMVTRPMATPRTPARASQARTSAVSPAPSDWAVRPVVPMRRKFMT